MFFGRNSTQMFLNIVFFTSRTCTVVHKQHNILPPLAHILTSRSFTHSIPGRVTYRGCVCAHFMKQRGFLTFAKDKNNSPVAAAAAEQANRVTILSLDFFPSLLLSDLKVRLPSDSARKINSTLVGIPNVFLRVFLSHLSPLFHKPLYRMTPCQPQPPLSVQFIHTAFSLCKSLKTMEMLKLSSPRLAANSPAFFAHQ